MNDPLEHSLLHSATTKSLLPFYKRHEALDKELQTSSTFLESIDYLVSFLFKILFLTTKYVKWAKSAAYLLRILLKIGFNILSPSWERFNSWIGSNPEPLKNFKTCKRIMNNETYFEKLKSSNLVLQWEFSKKPPRILKNCSTNCFL